MEGELVSFVFMWLRGSCVGDWNGTMVDCEIGNYLVG